MTGARDRPSLVPALSDVAPLAAEVYDRPMPFPLLKVINRQFGDFVSSQSARK